MIRKWTNKEIEILKKNYHVKTPKQISKLINRTYSAITKKAWDFGLEGYRKWTNDELQILKENYHIKSSKQISRLIDRKVASIRAKAASLGLTNYRAWSEKDISYLKEKYSIAPKQELAETLHRSYKTIVSHANFLKLKRNRWTEKELEILTSNYYQLGSKNLETVLNKSSSTISAKAKNLGLDYKQFWTKQEENFLKNNLGKMKRSIIANFLNRSMNSIDHKLEKLGLTEQFVSNLEKDFEAELRIMKFSYDTQVSAWKYKIDFVVNTTAIELNGTYWHCDSRAYPDGPKYNTQRKAILRDQKKYKYLKEKGYKVVIIWEYDFYNNWENVKQNLIAVLQSDLQDYDSAKTVKPEMAIPC